MKQTRMSNPMFTIAAKEVRAAFRNRLFFTMAILFLGLSILSVYIGSTTKAAEMRIYQETVAALTAKGAALPAAPEIHTLTILANLIDYVAVVGAILAVVLGYNALIEEKESGGLKLILSRPVFRDQLLTGKLVGGATVIAILLALVFLFNLVLLMVVGGIAPTGVEVLQLLAFTLVAFVYMLIFLALALWLSVNLNNSATVFLIALVVWMVVSFVIPQMADTQMMNSSVINSISGAVTQIPQDTVRSRAINFLSPTWHLRDIGGQLLQSAQGSGALTGGTLLRNLLTTLLILLTPTIALVAASFVNFLRSEALTTE